MKISVILPVINETFSLERTIETVSSENKEIAIEYIIVTSPKKTTPASRKVIAELLKKYKNIRHMEQKKPFIGGALSESFGYATGDYTVMMASDLETDPHTVKKLIETIESKKVDIVCTNRWCKEGGFDGYNPLKFILNKVFQSIFKLLYHTKLSDLTFAFRIYKTEILKSIEWEELKHPFFLETILKPLKLGYVAVEIPSPWKAREEGESQNTFMHNFAYFKIGVKVLFDKNISRMKRISK